MTRIVRLLIVAFLLATAVVGAGAIGASASGSGKADLAQVQVLHRAYGVGTVDVYVNGAKAIAGFKEGATTGFIGLPEGTYTFAVKAAGTSTTLLTATATIQGGESYTVTAKTAGGAALVVARVASSDDGGQDDGGDE